MHDFDLPVCPNGVFTELEIHQVYRIFIAFDSCQSPCDFDTIWDIRDVYDLSVVFSIVLVGIWVPSGICVVLTVDATRCSAAHPQDRGSIGGDNVG